MSELYATQLAMQKLAEWHERQRDVIPWAVGKSLTEAATWHNKAASDCYSAAIMLGEYAAKCAT